MIKYRNLTIEILLPLVLLLSLTFVFMLSDLDLIVSSNFFNEHSGWFLAKNRLWEFLYHYGPYPAIAIATVSLFVFFLSYFKPKLAKYRIKSLFLVLLMIIGPGIVVNSIFKEFWGRPRPRDVIEFNGEKDFLYVWERGDAHKGKAFPSGHASVGFYLIAPWFIFRKKRPYIAAAFMAGGLGYGTLMGIGRIVQGAHFVSDVIWSAGFIYFIGLALYYLFNLPGIPDNGSSGQETSSLPT